jgi:hypothetical protein
MTVDGAASDVGSASRKLPDLLSGVSKEAANWGSLLGTALLKSSRFKSLRYFSNGLIILVVLSGLLLFLRYPEKLDALLEWIVGH